MSRRLPIYVLLDCSESLAGDNLQAVEIGMHKMLSALSRNPHAIETAVLSVITFGAKAKTAFPLTEVMEARPPVLSPRPGTSLGAALDLLRESIGREVVKTRGDQKGDYKPMVFIVTDGYPTDDWRGPLKRLKAQAPSLATIYAIGVGQDVDFETLTQIADECIHSAVLSPESLSKLFVWLSASIQSQSVSPDGQVSLEKVPLAEGMELIDKRSPPKFSGKDQRLYFHVTCAKEKRLYMMTFRKNGPDSYAAEGNLKLPEDFFADGAMRSPPVDAGALYGGFDCPYCGAGAWGKCSFCGHLFCLDLESEAQELACPVCQSKLRLAEDSGSFTIDGSQG
jgi:uncharacterized protein YegL/DNA-directed RNA polymerase subunit RPC12/RpoP